MTFEKSKFIFDNDYLSPYYKKNIGDIQGSEDFIIVRDGIFSLLWSQFKGESIKSHEAISFQNAGRLDNSSTQLFFRSEKIKDNNIYAENILLFFYMDQEVMPLYILEDSLKFIQESLKVGKNKKIYCHITESRGKQTAYSFYFIKLITMYLGPDLKFLETVELFKLSDMSNWVIYDSGVQWVSGDSYLTHVCLSKNASILTDPIDFQFTSITKSYEVSQYHRMTIGLSSLKPDEQLSQRLKLFNEAGRGAKKNVLNIPSEFIELAYCPSPIK